MIDKILKGFTLIGLIAVIIRVFSIREQVTTYPNYTDVIKEIEERLNNKLDSIDATIVEVKISIEKNKGKEKIIINNREVINKEKQNALYNISHSTAGSEFIDSMRKVVIPSDRLYKKR